ncbi:hypothetical protein ACFYYH_18480 [Streptomyces sp. NPDC002018]|uniref:hypothetical protein n=1 Tax=Streptomyces sp. NPDC002018 TaxID=3364629 RepID=UPI0036A4CCA7
MRARRIMAGLALATTVGLGLMAAPAQAAPTAAPVASAPTEVVVDSRSVQAKHFYSSHWTRAECQAEGSYWLSQHPTWTATCEPGLGTDGRFKYHLYMWY